MNFFSSLVLAALAAVVVASAGCASSSEPAQADAVVPWTDTAMQNLVMSKCAIAGCHDGTQGPKFKGISESDMKANRDALEQVQSEKMPKRGSLTDDEKAIFAAFYQ